MSHFPPLPLLFLEKLTTLFNIHNRFPFIKFLFHILFMSSLDEGGLHYCSSTLYCSLFHARRLFYNFCLFAKLSSNKNEIFPDKISTLLRRDNAFIVRNVKSRWDDKKKFFFGFVDDLFWIWSNFRVSDWD